MATYLTNTISIKQPMIEASRIHDIGKRQRSIGNRTSFLANLHVILKSNA